jgi:hypothetical protein
MKLLKKQFAFCRVCGSYTRIEPSQKNWSAGEYAHGAEIFFPFWLILRMLPWTKKRVRGSFSEYFIGHYKGACSHCGNTTGLQIIFLDSEMSQDGNILAYYLPDGTKKLTEKSSTSS